jgi:hypothetical protein
MAACCRDKGVALVWDARHKHGHGGRVSCAVGGFDGESGALSRNVLRPKSSLCFTHVPRLGHTQVL